MVNAVDFSAMKHSYIITKIEMNKTVIKFYHRYLSSSIPHCNNPAGTLPLPKGLFKPEPNVFHYLF